MCFKILYLRFQLISSRSLSLILCSRRKALYAEVHCVLELYIAFVNLCSILCNHEACMQVATYSDQLTFLYKLPNRGRTQLEVEYNLCLRCIAESEVWHEALNAANSESEVEV